MKAIAYQLQRAADEGKLESKHVLCSLLESISRNLNVEKHGKRYTAPMQSFFEVILLWGGPWLANFVSLHIFGPEIHTLFRWRKNKCVSLDAGLTEHNFQTVQKIYQEVVDQKNLGKVPVLIAEDETASTAQVAYSEDKDVLVGFCGPKATDTEQHICRDLYNIPVGDGEEGYTNISTAFQDNKIGSLGRAVIINPLHPDLPKIPILIHPTCNKLNAAFVKHQWKEIDRLFKLYLEDTVGPLVGQSSDGDTRWRNLMMETATSNSEMYQPIPHEEGFIYTCNKHEKADGTYSISDLFDQDYVHNHKKLVNHLFHSSKQLTIGRYHVNSNHLTLLHQLFRFDGHGLQAEDLTRSDRQNWQSAERICFLKVQDCLLKTGTRW